MFTSLKRIVAPIVLAVCLLLTLAVGSFLASGQSLHGSRIARGATPYGWSCGGSVGTPC